jgi:hypothetical protein
MGCPLHPRHHIAISKQPALAPCTIPSLSAYLFAAHNDCLSAILVARQACVNHAVCNGVAAHPQVPPLLGNCLGEADNGGLGCCVVGLQAATAAKGETGV